MKILVAEDDNIALWALKSRLEKYARETGAEISVITATSKAEALAQMESHRDINLVITDMRMPEDPNDGNEVAAAALAKNIRVVVLSGSVEDVRADIAARCLRVASKREVPGLEETYQFVCEILSAK